MNDFDFLALNIGVFSSGYLFVVFTCNALLFIGLVFECICCCCYCVDAKYFFTGTQMPVFELVCAVVVVVGIRRYLMFSSLHFSQ